MLLIRISRQLHRLWASLLTLYKPNNRAMAYDNHHPFESDLFSGRTMSILLVLGLLLGTSTSLKAQATCNFAPGNYNPCNYDTANIIQEMIHPHSNLVMLAAHRGAHNTINPSIVDTILAPENSVESVGSAALLGYEMVEVDIKISADNVPILSHDTTLGRETLCPGCTPANAFNPFGAVTSANQALNPLVSSLTELQAKKYTLWTVQNPSADKTPVASLRDLLNYMTTNKIAMVIAIDVKDIPSALACWSVIKSTTDYLGRPYYKSVVFKMGAQIFGQTPVVFENTFGADYPNVLYWPYYTTNMIAPVGNNFGSEANMIASLRSWQASSVQLVGSEVDIKQNGGILTQMLAAAKVYNGVSATSVGSFSPTAEYLAPRDTTPQFFIGKDSPNSSPPTFSGYCCYELSNVFYNGAPNNQPSDTADNRGDYVNFLIPNGISVITTDEVTTYGETLQGMNLRHTEWLQDAFQGDSHCNPLNNVYPGCDANGTTVYTYCAAEGGTCSFNGARNVAYGANGEYKYSYVLNSAACNNATLGPDPIDGVVKACYYGPAILNWSRFQGSQPTAGVYCADEGGSCSYPLSTSQVAFGLDNRYNTIQPSLSPYQISCSNSTFSQGFNPDPAPEYYKTCFYTTSTSGAPTGYVLCAVENQTCTFAGAARIAFGANGKFSYRTFTVSSPESAAGGVGCNVSNFPDPVFGVVKSCYYQYATPVGAVINPPSVTGSGGTGGGSTGGGGTTGGGGGVGQTPIMGWSTWSFLRNNVNQANFEAQALAMHNSGLQAVGFQYANLDDFWYLNPSQTVDSYGRWTEDTSKFPAGLAGLAKYVHSLGLKFGMYLTPGIPVAAYNQNTPIQGTSYHARDIVSDTSSHETNYNFNFSNVMYHIDFSKPGAQAFLNGWANLLAADGVDYVKLDGVGDGDMGDVQGWGMALAQSGRPIHLELSNSLDINNGEFWRTYSNGWRTSGDIEAYGSSTLTNWNTVLSRFASTPGWQQWGYPGGFNDLDSLEVGNGSNDGLTPDQRKSTETLWAIAASPLLLGTDLTNLDPGDLAQLTNQQVLQIDQNGVAGAPTSIGPWEAWRAKQPNGSYAVALFNLGPSRAQVSASWASLGFNGSATVYDLWGQQTLGSYSGSYSAVLNSGASQFLLVTPQYPTSQYLAYPSLTNTNTLIGGAKVQRNIPTATDGVDVGYIGNGGGLQFNNVTASQAGTYNLTILYFNGDSSRNMSVGVNSGTATTYAFAGTGSFTSLGSKTIQVQLNAGANTITLFNAVGYAPDIDSITVQSAAAGNTTVGTGISNPVSADIAGTYEIQSVVDGMAVNVSQGSTPGSPTANNAPIIQWPYNGSSNSQWTFVPTSNGYYQIKNVQSGLDLVVKDASTTAGASIIQYSFGSAGNDQWAPVQNSDGTYTFYNVLSGQVLDDPFSSTTAGTQYDQWPANGQSNQKFNLIPITSPTALGFGAYVIQSVVDNMGVNVSGGSTPGGSTSNNAPVIQWPDTSGKNSMWTFVPTINGYYQIKNLNSGLDLAVQYASTASGAPIIQYSFGSSGNDQWAPVQNSDGTYTFYNLLSGQVLDDPNSSTTGGTQYDQWPPNFQPNQKFNLIPVSTSTSNFGTGTYEIQSVSDGMAVNVSGGSIPGGSVTNNAPIIQWPYDGSLNSQWSFIPTSNGYYQIQNTNSGLDLAVNVASVTAGAPIIQYSFGSSGNDQWAPVRNSDGTYTFYNRNSGQVLDIPGPSTTAGTQLDQWPSNLQSNQKFNLIPLSSTTLAYGTYELQSMVDSMAVNVSGGSTPGGSTANGAPIIQWPDASQTNSAWLFLPTVSGYYQLKNVHSGLALAVQNASVTAGAPIIQFSFGSSGNDQWAPVQNPDGTYTFYNRLSGQVLDDPASSTTAGTQYDQWWPTYQPNQKFNLISR